MKTNEPKRVVIVGGGFAGVNCAKRLGSRREVEVVLVDRRNHHLFQPLLYQVAMAGLSPADISMPIRSLFNKDRNVRVIQAEAQSVNLEAQTLVTSVGPFKYDFLVLAAGAEHTYFGKDQWEDLAPGLKTLAQATEIRRRVLVAFEKAEVTESAEERKALLTFVVVGGGPTGVELAGALGEMSRFTLARDFRRIDPRLTRVILIEAGPRILPSFDADLSARATRDLERLGVQVWTEALVTALDVDGVTAGKDRIEARTVLWAAGVQASALGTWLPVSLDRQGRVPVTETLSIVGHDDVFVIGDQAHCSDADGRALPGVATVALQQGRHLADNILREIRGEPRKPFRYFDKGQLATIGRSRAVLQSGNLRLDGLLAWLAWLLVHIYYLSGFRNRLLVLVEWAWSYLTFARGARLIVDQNYHRMPYRPAPPKEAN